MCSDDVGNRYISNVNASYWIYKELIGKGYKIMVFSGDADGVVPVTGTMWWVEMIRKELGLTLTNSWRAWYYQDKTLVDS